MTKSEFERIKAKVEERYKTDLAALKRVYALTADDREDEAIPAKKNWAPMPPNFPDEEEGEDVPPQRQPPLPPPPPPPPLPPPVLPPRPTTFADAVKEAVSKFDGVFSMSDVADEILKRFPKAEENNKNFRVTVSGQLLRLCEANILEKVDIGKGGTPSTYQKKQ